jgi:2-polyprenyl-6-methoxyphenol hydroxylase-like FAD-dependent oxidoreductase
MEENVDVLVAGAGPVGLQLALELQRRGVACVTIDQRPSPDFYCKALGVTPRTQEIWDQCGVLDDAQRRGTFLAGMEAAVDQGPVERESIAPGGLPYGFLSLPQYDTEDVLRVHLRRHGGGVRHGVRLVSFVQDPDGVTSEVEDAARQKTKIRSRWVVGCDGAHSTVRKGLGIEYAGEAYAMTFMLGDVCLDWNRSHAYGQRITHLEDDALRNVLVCIPIPGDPRRWRVSLMAPLELQSDDADLSSPPSLDVLRAEVLPILPAGTRMTDLRWSSYYRISHRIVSRYASGRCFLAGDAAHIHPPIGGQGMNTGLQDAHNLAWRLALAAAGRAAPGLLEGYAEERRPVGLDVVDRTTHRMDAAVTTGDVEFDQWRQDSQLFIHYRDSRRVAEDLADGGALGRGPRPGDRAPDADGLRAPWVAHPIRLAERMRVPGHLLLLWFDGAASADDFARAASLADRLAHWFGDAIAIDGIVAPEASVVDHERFPLLRDADGGFRAAYDARGACLYLLRPDRHVAFRADRHDVAALERYLERILTRLDAD